MLLCDIYITISNQFKAVFGRIMVVGPLTHCQLVHSKCDLKAAQKTCNVIKFRNLHFISSDSNHNSMEASKNDL